MTETAGERAIPRDQSIIPACHHYRGRLPALPGHSPLPRLRCTDEFRRQRGRRGADATVTRWSRRFCLTRELAALDGSPTEDLDAILSNPSDGSGLETADPLASIAWEYAVAAAFLFTVQGPAVIADGPRA